MTTPDPAASVRARLALLALEQKVEFQLLLSEFAIERLLYRLGRSRHRDGYVLKGAMLFRLWSPVRGRSTWDLDLLGHGPDGVADVADALREVCAIPCADGLTFDPDSLRAEEIRAAEKYAGVRTRLVATLAGARIPMQVDVGFGDAVTPPAERMTYPTLLDHPAPEILVYPREAVVAEKLEAMVSLGTTNSRMKDFYDLHQLAQGFAFEGRVLAEAIVATFARRGTPLPEEAPLAITPGFLADPARAAPAGVPGASPRTDCSAATLFGVLASGRTMERRPGRREVVKGRCFRSAPISRTASATRSRRWPIRSRTAARRVASV